MACAHVTEIRPIIIGAGGVGLALAADFQARNQDVRVFSRTPFSGRLTLDPLGAVSCSLPLKVEDLAHLGSRLSFDREDAAGYAFWVAVPAHASTMVFMELAGQLQRALSASKSKADELVFVSCGNGLHLAPDAAHLASLVGLAVDIRLERVLVYAGFGVSRDSSGARVTHGGGRLVRWGTLGSTRGGAAATSAIATPLFDWHLEADIRASEHLKFFVNLSLMLGIGPRLLPNVRLTEFLSPEQALEFAQAFEFLCLGSSVKLDAATLVRTLWETARTTGANVNSLSRVWHAGDVRAPQHFMRQLAQLMTSARPEAKRSIFELVEPRARAWGLELSSISDE